MHNNTFPQIKTARLLLRKLEVSDTEVILFLRSDALINKYIERPAARQTKTLEQAKAHIEKLNTQLDKNESITWGITLATDPKLIGTICLWNFSKNMKTAEIGYDLAPSFQNKGIMNEAFKAVLDFGFHTKNFKLIEAFTHNKNEPSKKLLVKNGFHHNESRVDNGNFSNAIFELRK